MYSKTHFQLARQSRDARFDGLFYIGVKTTKIYCRPICPAPTAKEENVEYFDFAHQAASAGYRPCIRCRPDAAPGSFAWQGAATTAHRAKKLIDDGCLVDSTTSELAQRLGISVRYLNTLFQTHFATTPKTYALYKQCDFAKQLLQSTTLSVTDIAFASGFASLRRFNDAFLKLYQLNPSKLTKATVANVNTPIRLFLAYRPPYNWAVLQRFLSFRVIEGLEWTTSDSYGRTFELKGSKGRFTATHLPEKAGFNVDIQISDLKVLHNVVQNIKRILDLDADCNLIEAHLSEKLPAGFECAAGLRLPGIWNAFEAGIRAILGQQVSVKAAKNYVQILCQELGQLDGETLLFPTPDAVANSDLAFFKMPQSRKNALIALAAYESNKTTSDLNEWLSIKGIGPWTVQYAQMRGQSNPDIFLGGDLGVVKALAHCDTFQPDEVAPFRSYLTFQLWNRL
jgi:AraC family transcriptional regulator of adaptative response / DNA-3-methyladenine glycosylase II